MQLHEFIDLLEAKGLKPRQLSNGQWLAHCPAHSDEEPSLSVAEGNNRILLHCFAGCDVDAICAALGVKLADLRTNMEFARRITYEVRNPDGTLVALHERIERNGEKTFVWRHPDGRKARGDLKVADLPLYGIHRLREGSEFVIIVEGEKCAEALWLVGIPAVGTYGATCDPADEPLRQVIERVGTIYLWADNDDAGRRHMERIGARLLALGATDVCWIDWQDAPEKGDAADAVAQQVNIQALLNAAKPFSASSEETSRNDAPTQSQPSQCSFCQLDNDELLAKAKPILEASDPLQEAVERIHAAFAIVGEDANLQLLLLALTTRVFPQPVNILVTGGTGQGKSFLTDAACAALPPCCHRRIVGASARALLFHPLQRGTVLQWLEMPELGGDTIAATILRSILWQAPHETTTDYLFVEWTPKGARRRSVTMPRQIALVTTKVELPRDEQLLSRFLVLEVRESPDKRKAVLTALAATFNGVPVDIPRKDALEPVRAFSEWLGRYKVHVTIPYAHALADLFAELPASERDFRDFATLLKLVAACALWNLTKRQYTITDDALQVTADLSDYEAVYRLLLPIWGKPRSAGLSETERRVAEALRQVGNPATAEELAQIVGITDRSVRRALNALAEKGIAERGEKRGRSYEWRLVADLDAFTVTLPTPEAVAEAWQPTPTSDQMDTFADITDIHGHKPMSAKNPANTSTFGFTDKRTRGKYNSGAPTQIMGDATFVDANSKENRVRDVREAKNLSPTSTFCGHDPMSTNVRDVRDDVKVTCPKCGTSRCVPPDALMLADPRCPKCGEVMKPAPEGDPPPDPSPSPEPAQSEGSERYIDTEEWIDQWWREVLGDQVVVDLETGEPMAVGDRNLAPPTCKEAYCPRCGHRESVALEVLLPSLCPVCDAPMDWGSIAAPADDRPDNPLVGAIERITDLSKRLGGGRR